MNPTTDSNPLTTWHQTIKTDVQTLRQLILLRTRPTDHSSRDAISPMLNALSKPLSNIDALVADLNSYVDSEIKCVNEMNEMSQRLKAQRERVEAVRAQAPQEVMDMLDLEETGDKENRENVPPLRKSVVRAASSGSTGSVGGGTVNKTRNTKALAKAPPNSRAPKPRVKKAPPPVVVDDAPMVETISDDELSTAPQYVRGRLTTSKVDAAVDTLNGILSKKYELLSSSPRQLSSADITIRQDMVDAKCKEAEGRHFITDADIKWGGARLDANMKCVINVLRHFGRLKEVRGKSKMRVFIVN